MAGPEIKVGANIEDAKASIKRLTEQLNDMGQAASKANHSQFRLISPEELGDAKRLDELWKQIAATQRGLRTSIAASGQNPSDIFGIDFSKVALTHAQQRSMLLRMTQGTSAYEGQFEKTPRRGVILPPGIRTTTQAIDSFTGGMGSTPGRILSRATEGAAEGGSGGGGIMGSGIGLLRGGLIGAGIAGLYGAGKMVAGGYESAKDQAITLDTLKMNMGNLNTSFGSLQDAATLATHGLLINSKEAAELFKEFNHLSGGVKDAADVMASVNTSVGVASAFGIDNSKTTAFFGHERQMMGGDERYMRRFALLIGESIVRSGLVSQSEKVLQAIESYTAQTSQNALARPNVSAYAGMYSALTSSHTPGLTPDVASSMLSQANSAVMNMGAAGEGGQTFMLSAFDRQGNVNPVEAQILASGGLFGTRKAMFGKDSEYEKYMRANGYDDAQIKRERERLVGNHGDETNYQSLMDEMNRMGASPLIKADMIQRLFGFHSVDQAMAFSSMKPKRMGALSGLLQRKDVNINPADVNMSGIKTLADIASAKNQKDLEPIITSMQNRGLIKHPEALKQAEGEGFKSTQDFLAKIAAHAGRQQTTGSQMLTVQKQIETKLTEIGQGILGPVATMKTALLKIAGVGSESELYQDELKLHKKEIGDRFNPKINAFHVPQLQNRLTVARATGNLPEIKKDEELLSEAKRKRDKLVKDRDTLIKGAEQETQRLVDAHRKTAMAQAQAQSAMYAPGNRGAGALGKKTEVSHTHRVEIQLQDHKGNPVTDHPVILNLKPSLPRPSGE